jgi:excisionase family DNA binding protein
LLGGLDSIAMRWRSASWDDEYLTVKEIAERLKLDKHTIRNWIDNGQVPVARIRRRVRIRRIELERKLALGNMKAEPTRPARESGWLAALALAVAQARALLERPCPASPAELAKALREVTNAAWPLGGRPLGIVREANALLERPLPASGDELAAALDEVTKDAWPLVEAIVTAQDRPPRPPPDDMQRLSRDYTASMFEVFGDGLAESGERELEPYLMEDGIVTPSPTLEPATAEDLDDNPFAT